MTEGIPAGGKSSAAGPAGRGNNRAYIALFGMATALVAGLVVLQLDRQYKEELGQWQARQTSLADYRGRMVSDWLKERQNDAEALASRAQVIAALAPKPGQGGPAKGSPASLQALARSLTRFAHPYGYSAIHVLNPQGEVVGQTLGAPEFDAGGRAAARATAETGDLRIKIRGDIPEKAQLSVCAPVFAEESESAAGGVVPRPLGAVVLRMQLVGSLFPILLSESVPTRTGETVLVRKEGEEVVYITPLRHVAIGWSGLRRPYATAALAGRVALEGQETFGEFVDYRGVRVLAATRRIPATGWGLIAKIDRGEALEDFRRMAWYEGLATALLLAAFGGLVFAYQRYAESVVVKKEQERFRALVLATAQIVWTTNPRGEVEDMPDWRAFTGQTRDEARGWGWAQALHPDDRERTEAVWREALKNRSLYDTEYRVRRRDGEFRYFSARAVPVLNADGSIREWVGFCADIQERRRAEQELRRLNRALRTLSECNQAMVRAREESELLHELCRLLVKEGGYRLAWVGYAEQDAGKTVRPMASFGFEEGYLETVRITWGESERGQGPTGRAIRTARPAIARNILRDPEFVPWREEALRRGYASTIALPLLQDGRPLGALMLYSQAADAFDAEEVRLLTELAHDLTYGIQTLRARAERARVEGALQRANAYNRGLLEASLDPLVTIAPDGKVTDVNRATEKVTGRRREELVGTDFSDYFTDPDKARAGYQQVFREGSAHDFELEIRHREGPLTPVLYNATVYRDETGEVAGVFAAARDITERQRAEAEVRHLNQTLEQRVRERTAELEAANRELEAFTYSVSHDLRAPLRHVDGFAKLLLENYSASLPEEARHYTKRIRNGARRMGLMVDDLLNLTRVGRRELSVQLTGLNSLLEEVRQELEPEAPGRKIEWRLGSLPFVECDPALMKQVLANLLSNALKFTRPRETAVIEVGTRDQDGSPTVFVRDNGVGFSMKYADKLFGVFQRLHRPEDFEGTGVGLATVQRVIQKHGGRVWAEGELNRGATFYFTLGRHPGPNLASNSKL